MELMAFYEEQTKLSAIFSIF